MTEREEQQYYTSINGGEISVRKSLAFIAIILAVAFMMMACCGTGLAQTKSPVEAFHSIGEGLPTTHFQSCTYIGGSSNTPKAFDASKRFMCGGVVIELHGTWDHTVEYGQIYRSELGELEGSPGTATLFDRDWFHWCRDVGGHQVITCGWGTQNTPRSEWMKPWNPNPNNYQPLPEESHDAHK